MVPLLDAPGKGLDARLKGLDAWGKGTTATPVGCASTAETPGGIAVDYQNGGVFAAGNIELTNERTGHDNSLERYVYTTGTLTLDDSGPNPRLWAPFQLDFRFVEVGNGLTGKMGGTMVGRNGNFTELVELANVPASAGTVALGGLYRLEDSGLSVSGHTLHRLISYTSNGGVDIWYGVLSEDGSDPSAPTWDPAATLPLADGEHVDIFETPAPACRFRRYTGTVTSIDTNPQTLPLVGGGTIAATMEITTSWTISGVAPPAQLVIGNPLLGLTLVEPTGLPLTSPKEFNADVHHAGWYWSRGSSGPDGRTTFATTLPLNVNNWSNLSLVAWLAVPDDLLAPPP